MTHYYFYQLPTLVHLIPATGTEAGLYPDRIQDVAINPQLVLEARKIFATQLL